MPENIDYFNNRITQEMNANADNGISTKYDELMQASKDKIAALSALHAKQVEQERIRSNTWAGKLGIDEGTVANSAVDGVAHLVKGAGVVAGQVASTIPNLTAAGTLLSRSDEQVQAYARYKQNKATPEDIALLNAPTTSASKYEGQVADGPSAFQLFKREEHARQAGREITNFFDVGSIADSTKQDALNADIGTNFDPNWEQTKKGFKAALKGDVSGAADSVAGIAKILFTAGEGVFGNLEASGQYILENIPQLAIGAVAKVGGTALAISNIGYAADNFTKGIDAYQKQNNGALPSLEKRQEMALQAASLAAAEHVGDKLSLGFMKTAKDAAGDAVKTGFKQGLKNVGKAGGEGFGTEAVTEGYQTYMEGEVTQKPATAKEVFTGAVIGGVAGSGISGGGRALAEVAGATPEHAQKKEADTQTKVELSDAIKSGDTSAYLDPKSKSYDPVKAAQAHFGNSQLEGTTDDAKQANLEKVSALVTKLEDQRSVLKETTPEALADNTTKIAQLETKLATATPEEAAGINDSIQMLKEVSKEIEALSPAEHKKNALEITKLDRQIAETSQIKDNLGTLIHTKGIDLEADVATADAPVDASNKEASQAAAQRVLVLSMASPASLSPEVATQLASNAKNGLSTQQRDYLRQFSAARIAENQLKDMGAVTQDVLGGGANAKHLGIVDYRNKIGKALAEGNQKAADTAMVLLSKFSASHNGKVALAQKLYEQAKTTRDTYQMVRNAKTNEWEEAKQIYSKEELYANGGLSVHYNSGKLLNTIQAESKALEQAKSSLQSAYSLKFTKSTSVDSTTKATPVAYTSTVSTKGQTQSNVDTTVDLQTSSTTAEMPLEESQLIQEAKEAFDTATAMGMEPSAVMKLLAPTTGHTKEEINATSQATHPAPVAESKVAQVSESKTEVDSGAGAEVVSGPVEYKKRNLIKDFFSQVAGSELGTQRPLVAVKDFLSKIAEKTSSIRDFISMKEDGVIGESQLDAWAAFREMAAAWSSTIQKNLNEKLNKDGTPSTEYRYTDLMQFLLQHGADKPLDLEENVKTAISYAAFSWVAENATRSSFNTPEEINLILGRDEDFKTGNLDEEMRILGRIGTRQNVVANSLGQRAVAALGFKMSQDAPVNLLPQLESAMGMHVAKLLLDEGILVRKSVSAEEMKALTHSESTVGNHAFLALTRGADYALSAKAEAIYKANKGSQGFLDKLFSVESAMKAPSFEPIPFTQKYTRNTKQKVPAKLAKIVAEKNAEANYVRQDMWNLMYQLDETVALSMAGVTSVSEQDTHKSKRASIQAKNDGLTREYQRLMEFFGGMKNMDQAMYFEHSVWKQQRVGIATNMINPQSSKIHRFMLFRKAWETKVDMGNSEQMDNFKLRVLEGLGTKTDKQANDKSLAGYDKTVNAPEIQAAVAVLLKTMRDEKLTSEDQQALLTGVQKGGEKFHSLDALMALAHESFAKSNGKTEFTVQMMGEVDGVTNGPMLSHLLLGAANTVEQLFGLLNKGGFFQEGNKDTQYNVWRGKKGNQDMYETTTRHVLYKVHQLTNSKGKDYVSTQVLDSVYAFTGMLENKDTGSIEKEGRNIIKKPLTAMVFGSAVPTAIDGMAEEFVETVYAAMEKAAKDTSLQAELFKHLKVLGVSWNGTPDLMETLFTENQKTALKQSFKNTLGKAVKATMEEDFSDFMSKRKELNNATELSFELYNAAYKGMREAFIKELTDKGDIALNGKGAPVIHDLTNQQEAELRKRIKSLAPVMHTLMSKDSNDLNAGLYISKSARKMSDKPTYKSEVKFGTPFADGTLKQLVTGQELVESAPGVAMSPMAMHSTDSAISHYASEGNEVLNVHDAHGSGLGGFSKTAENLNQATWNAMLNYSPASEVFDALSRTVTGLNELLQNPDTPASVKQEVVAVLVKMAAKKEIKPVGMVMGQMLATKAMAYEADKMKLSAMKVMTSVDQYALEGGNYLVTKQDRKNAAKMESKLEAKISDKKTKAMQALENILQPAIEAATKQSEKPAPKEAKTAPASLLETLKANKATPAKDVLRDLYRQLKAQKSSSTRNMQITLLEQLGKLAPEGLMIHMGIPKGGEPSSHAWYVWDGDVYLNPAIAESNVTEALLHEMIHAVTSGIIAREIEKETMDPNYSSPAMSVIADLYRLKVEAEKYIKANKLTQYEGIFEFSEGLHELVAWGMTNQGFQRDVLSKITGFKSQSLKNKLVTGWKAFTGALVSILFKDASERRQEIAENGLGVLIMNVSGLLAQAEQDKGSATQNKPDNGKVLSMAALIMNMTTLDIHEALDDGKLSPEFVAHQQSLLTGIVEKLHGPFGSLKAVIEQNQALSPTDVWLKAKNEGTTPFATQALASGFQVSEQVAFVMEQVEVTMKAALDGGMGQTTMAYTELAKLYKEVRSKLQPSDFSSPELYDFIFKMEKTNGDRSDYLARFAAMGLAHPEFHSMLDMVTKTNTKAVGTGYVDRLKAVFTNALNWLAGKLTHTFDGQNADEKLTALVEQLVGIEAKCKAPIAHMELNLLAPVEQALKAATEVAKDKIEKFGRSKFFKESKNGFVKMSGGLLSAVAGDRTDYILEAFNRIHDEQFKKGQGVVAGLINEIRGANSTNMAFHVLLRAATHRDGEREGAITSTAQVTLESFDDKGAYLTQEDKAAITSVFMRTDMAALLDHFTMAQLQDMLSNPSALGAAIHALENQLGQYKQQQGFYTREAKILGYKMATGEAKGRDMLLNARNIAELATTSKTANVSAAQATSATVILDQLVSLYALRYTDPKHIASAQAVMAREIARGDESGVFMVLNLHKKLQEQSKERLFEGNERLMVKGYTTEIYNPHREVKIATEAEGDLLVKQGYSKGEKPVATDPADPDRSVRYAYVRNGGGLRSYLTGIFSYTGEAAKGSRSASDSVKDINEWKADKQDLRKMRSANQRQEADRFRHDPGFDPSKVTQSYAVPTLNSKGEVVNYRYLMQEKNKDALLERDNRFDKVLGAFAGNIFDKETTKSNNRTAVQALYDQYKGEYAERAESYIKVGAGSQIAEHRDIYRMMPDDTKQAIKEIWGEDYMMVRSDLMDINFGYRKSSLTDAFDKTPQERQFMEKFFVDLMTHVMGEKAAFNIRRAEDIWQELVHETKDILVVKNVVTLLDNVGSNVSALFWLGVPMKDALYHHRVALKGALAFRKDSAALADLKQKLSTGYSAANKAEMEREVIRLEDAIARNPVKELIDAGLMPTIVEDVTPEDDRYSYKSNLVTKVGKYTGGLNKHVVAAGKVVYMAKDTQAYQFLSHATQLSDFIARYTLYQHMIARKTDPMTKEDAIQLASDVFINYDIPSHRTVQYLNDMGIVWFTKYYLRIQKVIAHLYAENPGRAIGLLSLNHFFAAAPVLMDSGFAHKMGNNPFSLGALKYPGTLDELATVKMGMSPFN